jgi:hypothetical protein
MNGSTNDNIIINSSNNNKDNIIIKSSTNDNKDDNDNNGILNLFKRVLGLSKAFATPTLPRPSTYAHVGCRLRHAHPLLRLFSFLNTDDPVLNSMNGESVQGRKTLIRERRQRRRRRKSEQR